MEKENGNWIEAARRVARIVNEDVEVDVEAGLGSRLLYLNTMVADRMGPAVHSGLLLDLDNNMGYVPIDELQAIGLIVQSQKEIRC